MNPTEAPHVVWQPTMLSQTERSVSLGQMPRCFWFTGLPCAGKTTLAIALEQRLHRNGRHTCLLDGDNLRHGLTRDLGFTEADRIENVRRVAEVARLMVDAGLIVIVALISPFSAGRQMARGLFAKGEFIEIYVKTPFEECERRDQKGLYAMARREELSDFTGISSRYESPKQPEVCVDTCVMPVEECVDNVLCCLELPTSLRY